MKEYLKPAEVAALLGVSRVTLWRYSKRPDFPRKIPLTSRKALYKAEDVERWLKQMGGATDER